MRARLLFLALCALLLAGCQSSGGEVSSQPEPAPVPKTPQELLEEQTIDEYHDAFLVDTGGRMGTLLVTTELDIRKKGEFEVSMNLSVWNPADMSRPIQTRDWMTLDFGDNRVVDVNFDGYSDFICLYARGVQAEIFHCMRWDEEEGLFAEEPEFAKISSPGIDPETRTIYGWNRESGAGDGVTTFHQWEDGELVCIRRIEVFQKNWRDYDSPYVVTVKDRIDGELREVYRTETQEYFDERFKWEDLDYHGETENN